MADRPRMLFNAFNMYALSHHAQGLWAEPDSRQLEYNDPKMWVDLAKLLERGMFDTLFFADVLGPYEAFRGSRDAAVYEGMQFPTGDPSVLIPLLAYHTENLGFTLTQNILQEHPYPFARKMSTLDHLTGGRVAWNIVTTFLASAGRNLGYGGLPPHDERYARAEDFTTACVKLWENSWDADAVVRDRVRRQFADPAKVHDVDHEGPYYTVYGPHLCEPSPQRTPVLFQAGMSPTGRSFAGRWAEALFINSVRPAEAADVVTDVRQAAAAAGRDPRQVKIFVPRAYVIASTEAEAAQMHEELLERQTEEGNLARMSVFLDHDFGAYAPNTPVAVLQGRDDLPPRVQNLVRNPQYARLTLQQAVLRYGNRRTVGTPEQVADEITAFQDIGVDGINLEYVVSPTTFSTFIDQVVPLLQQRGVMQRTYRPGTLREKFFGAGPHLPSDHPARRTAAAHR